MLDLIMNLFGYENINKIWIQPRYKIPKNKKFKCKMKFHDITGEFQDKIVINKSKILLDGYITYRICKYTKKKKRYVKVIVVDMDPITYDDLCRGYRKET